MKQIFTTLILAAILGSACGQKHQTIEISDQPVSTNFMGNGVEWSA